MGIGFGLSRKAQLTASLSRSFSPQSNGRLMGVERVGGVGGGEGCDDAGAVEAWSGRRNFIS